MKRLASALVLCLALASSSVAYAAAPTFSSAITIAGSETWKNGAIDSTTAPATPTVGFSVSASGTGYAVNAAYTLGGNVTATSKPIVNTLGKYTAKFTDGKYVFDIWGNAAETADVATLFSKVKSAKAADGSNWRLRTTYEGGKVVADIDNAKGTLSIYAKKAIGDTSVGAAVVKDLAKLNNAAGSVDVWASTKVGPAAVSGELLLVNKAVTGPDSGSAVVKAVADIAAGINATVQLDWGTSKAALKRSNNTYVLLKKSDMNLEVNGIVTNKDTGELKTKLSVRRDPGLNYIYGDITKNLSSANNDSTWNKLATTNVDAVNAEFGIRGSNDQAWGDVFSTSSDKWLKNKTYVFVAKATKIAATKVNDSDLKDDKDKNGNIIDVITDDYPSLVLSAEGVYCAIPSKLWVSAKATAFSDEDESADMDIDVTAKAKHKTALNSKIALESDATISVANIGTANATNGATIATKATYTFASNMNIYASMSEAMVAKIAPVNTLVIGYSIKF